MDDFSKAGEEIVHLARLALAGRRADVLALARRLARRYREVAPELAAQLVTLLQAPSGDRDADIGPTLHESGPLRGFDADVSHPPVPAPRPSREPAGRRAAEPVYAPVDLDSRLDLVRTEWHPAVPVEPIWSPSVRRPLEQLVAERRSATALAAANLAPTRTAIFFGPPGVGKTLAARWVARELKRPLIVLDLATVMSSLLGRTGTNLRLVMDHAKSLNAVLLLDEIDALAKRRDDQHEVGELKRLVTALLQEIDAWPASGLLLAATNHPDLLDPAAWRRFEMQVDFGLPTERNVRAAVHTFLGAPSADGPISNNLQQALTTLFLGRSFSDIERELTSVRRAAVLNGQPLKDELVDFIKATTADLPRRERLRIATALAAAGFSQRQVHTLTGVSRDTLRKAAQDTVSETSSARGAGDTHEPHGDEPHGDEAHPEGQEGSDG